MTFTVYSFMTYSGLNYFSPAMHNVLGPLLAAIFAGNSVVVKCSETVAWSSTYFVGAVRECISACGWDPDIVQVQS